jgi:hypothetical protein
MYQSNIKRVQIETNKIIIETEKILESLIETEKNTENKNKVDEKTLSYTNLKEDQRMLKNEKLKVDILDYVVAVVGTMKAGKSMTINAIVGQEVLPSREFPMTTLPTLITHVPNKTEPSIKIEKIEPFNILKKKIKSKLKNDSSALSSLGEIKELGEKIKNDEIEFKTEYKGQEDISKFLKEINDLMRIAKELNLEPPYAEYTDVVDLPRIEVEFYHLSQKENNSNAKLTLLDTPGPDEFKHSSLLKNIFEQQLKRASAVMLLVDYTKMNSQSDVEVKEQVKEVANMIGKQHLFVLLNKFDQRKRSDDVEEKKGEAKRLIAEDVLKGQIDTNNIYPISAKSAFYANFGLRELEKKGKIDKSLNWIDDFGVTLMGEDWEDDIDDIKRVRKKCKKTWEKSFFEEPLENIISTSYSDAPFLSLESSLDKLDNLLREYSNAFKTRKNAYQKELSELKDNIKSLKKDIKKVTEISKSIDATVQDKIKNTEKSIEEKSKSIIQSIQDDIEEKLQTNQKKREEEKKARKNEGHNVNNNSFLHKELWAGGLFDIFKNHEPDNTESDEMIYKDEAEAKKVIEQMNENFIKILDDASKKIEKEINDNIKDLSGGINNDIKEKLGDLVSKIEQKLGDESDSLNIILPQLKIDFDVDLNGTLSSSIKTDKETYREVGDAWYQKFLNKLKSNWGTVEKTRNIFKIEKKEILDNIDKALKDMQKSEMSKLSNKFDIRIKKPIDEKLQALKKEIDGYIAEQVEIMDLKEKMDKRNIEKMITNNYMYIKKTDTLKQRTNEAKKQLR